MKKYIIYLTMLIITTSCSDYKYPENKELSDKYGALIDTAASYLIEEITFKGIDIKLDWDKDRLQLINSFFKFTSEPLLYNYYLERDVYRIVIVRKDHDPLILSINKTKNQNWIVSKKIFEQTIIAEACGFRTIKDFQVYTRELDNEELDGFTQIWKTIDFFNLPNNEVSKNYENFCLIEAHEKEKYWAVYRELDDDTLKEVSTYVKGLTGF